jgi:hypothetical protein
VYVACACILGLLVNDVMAILVYLCLIMTRDYKKIVNQTPLGYEFFGIRFVPNF